MATAHLLYAPDEQTISVEDYLHSSFETDMDYVDGYLEERNLGEWEHGDLQSELVHIFRTMLPQWRCRAAVECRLQVGPTRFRVPDVMVLHPGQAGARVIRQAPLICIEILSPEDRWSRTEVKLNDYLSLGVKHVWAIEPLLREAFIFRDMERTTVKDGILEAPGTPVRINLNDVFASLDAAADIGNA